MAIVSSKHKEKQTADNSDDETLTSRARKIAFSTLNLSASEFEQFVTEAKVDKVLKRMLLVDYSFMVYHNTNIAIIK